MNMRKVTVTIHDWEKVDGIILNGYTTFGYEQKNPREVEFDNCADTGMHVMDCPLSTRCVICGKILA